MPKKTAEQISFNMKRIKNKDSEIELMLRRELWTRGLRYTKNDKNVIGKPDIVFSKKKVAVFCDSEFWHGYDWETKRNDIKSNRDFWISKIERNMERDAEVNRSLSIEGWTVIRFWGKEIKTDVRNCADRVEEKVRK
jgi:DNA mismatch endonuclease Vsr